MWPSRSHSRRTRTPASEPLATRLLRFRRSLNPVLRPPRPVIDVTPYANPYDGRRDLGRIRRQRRLEVVLPPILGAFVGLCMAAVAIWTSSPPMLVVCPQAALVVAATCLFVGAVLGVAMQILIRDTSDEE